MILAIYCGGGLGREVLELAKQINSVKQSWSEIVFVDDVIEAAEINGAKKYSFDEFIKIYKADSVRFVIAIGEPQLRSKLFEKVSEHGYEFDILVHPTVNIPKTARLGKGTIVCAYSLISCNVTVEENVYIQPFTTVGHDILIKSSCVISPYCELGGCDVIGHETYIGVHAALKERITIGNRCIIGMCSAVIKDLPDEVIVLGNPARILKKNEQGRVFK